MFKSLRNRLLALFLLLAFALAITLFPVNYFRAHNQQSVRNLEYQLNDLQVLLLKDIKISGNILNDIANNTQFFITSESPFIDNHRKFSGSIVETLKDKNSSINQSLYTDTALVRTLQVRFDDYCEILDSIVYCIYKRGYRDFGLEGEMISNIYESEQYTGMKQQTYYIRKAERDYLSRNDTVYVPELNGLVDKLIVSVTQNSSYSVQEKMELVILLKNYRNNFNKLVSLDYKIGKTSNTGLTAKLQSVSNELELLLSSAIIKAREEQDQQLARINVIYGLLSLFILLGAVFFSLYVSKSTVRDLESLNRYISELTRHNFNYHEKLSLRKASSEIREIYKAFRNMVAQLKIRETQRDMALNVANESKLRYKELSDLLPQSIFETDKLGNLIYVNKAWFEHFGYTITEINEGLNLIEILNIDKSSNLIGSDKVENCDYIAIKKDGSRFPATVYVENIFQNNKPIGRRGIIIDASLRNKYIESLKRETLKAITSDKHKSSFLANMSHEIRTPMNSILGFANLIKNENIPEEQRQAFIDYIQSSGQILLNLIDDIIDIAKIEAGEIKIKPENCNPANIISELLTTFEGYKVSMGKENILLLLNMPSEEINFSCDAFRLRQILTNLVSNAIKFTEKGSINIGLKIKNQHTLEFTIEDTGIGLSHQEMSQIFERFRRSQTSENKNISGTGLGLSISKNLTELLGGEMWVNSEPGIGTKFSFTLPYIRIAKPEKVIEAQSLSTLSLHSNWAGYVFLIAEDDDFCYTYIKEVLGNTGATLVRTVNGKEAVEAVKLSEKIDLVLMDINMPSMDGYQATRAIKQYKPSLPVIAQTAFAMDGDKEKSVLAGCDDYITKPIHAANLMAKIAQFIGLGHDKSVLTTDLHNQKFNIETYDRQQKNNV